MSVEEAMALQEPAARRAGVVVAPIRGSALLFYNHRPDGSIDPLAVHAGCRVLAGEKWGANHWVRMPAMARETEGEERGGEARGAAGGEAVGGSDQSEELPSDAPPLSKSQKKRMKEKAKRQHANVEG